MLKWFNKRKISESSVKNQNQETKDGLEVSDPSHLTDADYEFLFNQLLDGVANGWNQRRVIKFFQNLGTRGEEDHWVAWLEKFSTKIPDVTNDSQRRLGAIMLRLAEVTQSAAELSQLSAISSQIGKKLFFGQTANLIWEYDGLDVVTASSKEEEHSELETELETELENTAEPSSNPAVLELVESWFNLGLQQASMGDFHEAIASWRKALELNPQLAEIWHNLGSALGRLERYPEAIASFDRALEIDPQSDQAWNDRAHAFYQMQQWEQAIDSWNRAISINVGNHQFWYHHGCALEQLQRFDEAIASYRKALEINPDFQPARAKYDDLKPES